MAERVSEPGKVGSEAPGDGSRSVPARLAEFRAAIRVAGRPALAVLVVGLLSALLLIVSEFSTIASVDVAGPRDCEVELVEPDQRDRCVVSGFERHGGAFILFGLLVAAMTIGASAGRSRPAAAALVAIGVVVVLWSLLLDLPETSETGAIGPDFESATAHKGLGLYLEIFAGGLAVLAGVMRLTARDREQAQD